MHLLLMLQNMKGMVLKRCRQLPGEPVMGGLEEGGVVGD